MRQNSSLRMETLCSETKRLKGVDICHKRPQQELLAIHVEGFKLVTDNGKEDEIRHRKTVYK